MRHAAPMLAGVLLLAGAVAAQAPVERRAPQHAQTQHPEAPESNEDTPVTTLRVESRLVNVAVNVVDETGAPVPGLKREDFEVAENEVPQRIAFFERESTTPLSIVMAIDASESVLRNERLERDAARHFVRTLLRSQDELDLMDFADTVREVVPFTNQTQRIEQGLGELQHGDATALYDAIYLASQRLAATRVDDGRRRVLMLITDGNDTAKHTVYSEALEQAQRAGAMVYSLIVVPVWADAGRNTGGEHALIQMANDTGGKYYFVQDPKDLEPAFAQVSDDLRTQYVVGYYAPQQVRQDALRSIQIRLKDPALAARYKLRYRTGYYAQTQ
ncbi:MAG: VWA domain-containing protein [Acidobacteriota bacterium]|nr:VWA domain-containing protein [Acidobacteriota bacterium]